MPLYVMRLFTNRHIPLACATALLLAAGGCLWLALAQSRNGRAPAASAAPAASKPRLPVAPHEISTIPQQKHSYIPAPLRRAPLPGPFTVQFVRVVDGDTFEGRLRVWFGQEITTLIRLRNVDAPELKARCAGEAQLAQEARQTLEDILHTGTITLTDISLDKYAGRVIANVSILAKAGNMGQAAIDDVGQLLLAGGYARPYQGGRRKGWCS